MPTSTWRAWLRSQRLTSKAPIWSLTPRFMQSQRSTYALPSFPPPAFCFFCSDRALATSLCCRVTSGKPPRPLRGASPASSKCQSRPPHHNPSHGVLQKHCPITNLLILSILICRLALLDRAASLCQLLFITCGTYAEDHVLTYITDTGSQV